MRIENKLICLNLNSSWQPIGYKTVKDSICDLVGGDFLALDIQYEEGDFSKPTNITPMDWENWISLPIREFDFEISSTKLTVRVPTVLVSKNFATMPLKRMKLSKDNIWKRDNGICQYSNKALKKEDASVDHVMPKCRGGGEGWENLVLCHKDINRMKGKLTPKEAGLKLKKLPKEPLPVPAGLLIKYFNHFDWKHFFIN